MATVAETVRGECENLGERATDVWRRAAKMTDEVGALKTAVQDVLAEGKDVAAKGVESIRRTAHDLGHVPDDVASRVRQEPLRSMGLAVGIGLAAGCLLGWLVTRTIQKAA